MQFDISTVISLAAIGVMFYCLWLVISLGKNVPGGVVGRTWRTLTMLVAFFTAGFLVTPFFGLLPPELMKLIVALIFLFGAIYVVITVRLIHRIIEELAG
jgi:prepilin signal peptidase PulO-like enzyme (type II secretory pathway)